MLFLLLSVLLKKEYDQANAQQRQFTLVSALYIYTLFSITVNLKHCQHVQLFILFSSGRAGKHRFPFFFILLRYQHWESVHLLSSFKKQWFVVILDQ